MLVDPAGRAYVGNFGFDAAAADPRDRAPAPTSLTGVSADGRVTEAAAGLMFPNGMVLTPDGATLIVAEAYGARSPTRLSRPASGSGPAARSRPSSGSAFAVTRARSAGRTGGPSTR